MMKTLLVDVTILFKCLYTYTESQCKQEKSITMTIIMIIFKETHTKIISGYKIRTILILIKTQQITSNHTMLGAEVIHYVMHKSHKILTQSILILKFVTTSLRFRDNGFFVFNYRPQTKFGAR